MPINDDLKLCKQKSTKIEEDYINRKDVLAIIDYLCTKYINNYNRRNKVNQFWSNTMRYVVKKVNDLPTANVSPVKHGKWIDKTMGFMIFPVCSNCNNICKQKYNYCPNCGAKMDMEDK